MHQKALDLAIDECGPGISVRFNCKYVTLKGTAKPTSEYAV